MRVRERELPPGNLPVQLKEFVGRREELAELSSAVRDNRLVTLLGPVGIGKTRLALRLAEELSGEFPDGAWLVELAGVSDAEVVIETIASVMGAMARQRGDPLASLCDAVRNRRALIVVDNCEQVLDQLAPVLARLLRSSPHLRVIATSRTPIRIGGERQYPVPPLAQQRPGSRYAPEDLGRMDAVALFVSRARLRRPGFAVDESNGQDVVRLVRFLDGLPLALELAAGWAATLSPAELLRHITGRMQDLVEHERAGNPRHASLWAAIDSSFLALAPACRALLVQLAVFSGGWNVEAMQAVCDPETDAPMVVLRDLVDHSLVTMQASPGGPTRFRMLQVIRRYAMQRLREAGQDEAVERRFAAHFARLAATAASALTTRAGPGWLQVLDVELDNLRAVLALDRVDPDLRLRVATALVPYWHFRGLLAEGRLRLDAALAGDPAPALAVAGLNGLARLSWSQGELGHAARVGRRAFRTARLAGDRAGEAWALVWIAKAGYESGRVRWACCLAERACQLGDELADERLIAACVLQLGEVAAVEGRLDDADALLGRAIQLYTRTEQVDQEAIALLLQGRLRLQQGRLDEAEAAFIRSLSTLRDFRLPRHTAPLVESLAAVFAGRGDRVRAARLAGAGAGLLQRMGARPPATAPGRNQVLSRLGPLQTVEARRAFEEGRTMELDEVIADALGDPAPPPVADEGAVDLAMPLSPRELEVAGLVAQGLTNQEIGRRLFISQRTVEGHVSGACNKFGFNNRVELAAEIIRRGLGA